MPAEKRALEGPGKWEGEGVGTLLQPAAVPTVTEKLLDLALEKIKAMVGLGGSGVPGDGAQMGWQRQWDIVRAQFRRQPRPGPRRRRSPPQTAPPLRR